MSHRANLSHIFPQPQNVHPIEADGSEMSDTSMSAFKKQASIWLPITAVLAILGSSLYLLLFRRYAKVRVFRKCLCSVNACT